MQSTFPFSSLIEADKFYDLLPLISTGTNLYLIFQKYVLIPIANDKVAGTEKNHYFTYLEEKSLLRCIILLFPGVGNLIIYLYDWACPDDGRALALAILLKEGAPLEHASQELRADRELVHTGVKKWGWGLQYASENLRDDEEIVRDAVNNSFGMTFRYASTRLQNKKALLLDLIKDGHESVFEYASDQLRDDDELIDAAIEASGLNLEYVSEDKRRDKDLVMRAVKNSYNGSAIQFASLELQQDPDLVALVETN